VRLGGSEGRKIGTVKCRRHRGDDRQRVMNEEISLLSGGVYIMKRRGPRKEPLGTPQVRVCGLQRPSHFTERDIFGPPGIFK